jgi:hypothetical protein
MLMSAPEMANALIRASFNWAKAVCGGIAIERRHVGFLQRDRAACTSETHGVADQRFWQAGRASDKAHMNQVERAIREARAIGVRQHIFDISGPMRTRMVEEDSVGVQADDAAGTTDAGAKEMGDAAGAAAQIKTCPARPDANAVQHRLRLMDKSKPLDVQTLNLAFPVLKWVVSRLVRPHTAGSLLKVHRWVRQPRPNVLRTTCRDRVV